MNQSKKAYDILTWMIAGNIIASISIYFFPYGTIDISLETLLVRIGVSGIAGVAAAFSGAIIFSKFIPNAERGVAYTLISTVFVSVWTFSTTIIQSIQAQLNLFTNGTSYTFPLSSIFFIVGILVWIFALMSFSGADLER